MKISIPEQISVIPQRFFDDLEQFGEVRTFTDFPESDEEFIKRVGDAEVVIVKWADTPAALIDEASNLKHIITLSAGFGHVPTAEARAKGITVSNCPTHNSQAVAEHIIALMFAVNRKIVEAQVGIQNGLWRKSQYSYLGTEIQNQQMGIIGYGNIGKRTGKMAEGLGMNVVGLTSASTDEEHEKVLKESDVIVLSLPYTPQVENMISKTELEMMKSSAILINVSREAIVNQTDLLAALENGLIRGAGLDVVKGAVVKGSISKEVADIAKMPNVVLTPHMAFNTQQAAERMATEMVDNVKAIAAGKPINVVN